jgi:hypothetical protein
MSNVASIFGVPVPAGAVYRSSKPVIAIQGDVYFDPEENRAMFFDGTAWKALCTPDGRPERANWSVHEELGFYIVQLPANPPDIELFVEQNGLQAIRRGRECICRSFDEAALIRLKFQTPTRS